MILEEATKEAFGYCADELTPRSGKPIIASCESCGVFRIVSKHDYHRFCSSCIRKERNSPMFGKSHSKETLAVLSAKAKTRTGERGSNWRGGKVKRICRHCKKVFYVYPAIVKYGYGKYCSRLCQVKAQRHNARPVMTKQEKIFKSICINNNLPFHFVGDGSLWLENANPDFVHNTKKIVVEVFGDYFHSPLLNRKLRPTAAVKGRRKQLKEEGYKCIIIWESDLKREDAEAFVIYILKKEKAI